jgi:ribosome-associated protein
MRDGGHVTKRNAPATRTRKTPRTAPARAARATKSTAKKIAGYALEKKASDVLVMDLRTVTDVTGFFVVCTGGSNVQVKAIVDNVLEKCRQSGVGVYHVEGYDSLRWVLIDLVDVVVHVFQPEVRSYYQLERLWGDAPAERLGDAEVAAS